MTPAGTALASIEASALGAAMRESAWLYPAAESVHTIGIALLFGSIAVLDLRLLGFGRALPVRTLARHILPWSLASFALIVPSGLAMFVAHASDFVVNSVFAAKFALIFAAGCNAAVFHAGTFPSVAKWDVGASPPLAARIAAALSLLLWVAVIACGRALGYV